MGVLTDPTLTTPPEQTPAGPGSGPRTPRTLLAPAGRPHVDRTAPDAAERVAEAVREQARGVDANAPVPRLWQTLAALGRADLCVARLTEGHIDAVRILREAGREPVAEAIYGVWASASGGTGLRATADEQGWRVEGTMRFCSGAWFLDRALTVVATDQGKLLVDIDVQDPALTRLDDTWPALGMDASRSVDIEVRDLKVPAAAAVGEPGFYLDRPGFALGGAGVAAVWLGGAHGVLNAVLATTHPERASAHQRAHLGAMATAIAAADALLTQLGHEAGQARETDEDPTATDMTAARTAVEQAVNEVLARAPRVTGPNGLCRNGEIAHRLADLEIYVRQHHAEADYELLGTHLLEHGTLLGRSFR
ncbi:acyl-CoA dehydrogenase family protein [Kineosporia babensis]|uniref:Acyl-CoA/acyl-ACP dehydrogenase n=1 Tax=Kineosporia babensis TaxID=499548 RepID=A0A9X1N9M8_9ACTN|nr:acyl-CoA dehydrogenase family protein [Kineosporia babensis]MCD5310103.1 acyl-CoA/acyl-ACP dehydrogenase [Kineosporia babensis]